MTELVSTLVPLDPAEHEQDEEPLNFVFPTYNYAMSPAGKKKLFSMNPIGYKMGAPVLTGTVNIYSRKNSNATLV